MLLFPLLLIVIHAVPLHVVTDKDIINQDDEAADLLLTLKNGPLDVTDLTSFPVTKEEQQLFRKRGRENFEAAKTRNESKKALASQNEVLTTSITNFCSQSWKYHSRNP
jgi:hypothetical protein